MADDNRIIGIKGDDFQVVLVISLTDDYEPFLLKGQWDFRFQDEQGKYLVIEKMCCNKKWNMKIRRTVQDVLESTYPYFEEAVWIRSKEKDNIIKVKRSSYASC